MLLLSCERCLPPTGWPLDGPWRPLLHPLYQTNSLPPSSNTPPPSPLPLPNPHLPLPPACASFPSLSSASSPALAPLNPPHYPTQPHILSAHLLRATVDAPQLIRRRVSMWVSVRARALRVPPPRPSLPMQGRKRVSSDYGPPEERKKRVCVKASNDGAKGETGGQGFLECRCAPASRARPVAAIVRG